MSDRPVALITGAARRIGASIAHTLHSQGYNLVLHYHHSDLDAAALRDQLNQQRPNSTAIQPADLTDVIQVRQLAQNALSHWQRIDLLVNNASSFYPTPLQDADEAQWDDLIGSNLKGPYFLCQALAQALKARRGAIINIADIYGERPLAGHSIYCIAKAGNRMLTKSLAKELAPEVRVNGIAPGAILWPENRTALTETQQNAILNQTPLHRTGAPEDIAQAVLFLAHNASYITGQTISIDGGRRLSF